MVSGYINPWEHYEDEQRRIELLIRIQLASSFSQRSSQPLDRFKGLIITDEEVAALLAEIPASETVAEESDDALVYLIEQLRQLEAHIERRLKQSESVQELPFLYLARKFDLSYWECQVIIFCLAIELDRKYEKLYAYLQDDVTCKYPTVELIAKLLGPSADEIGELRAAFAPQSKLWTHFLQKTESASHTILARPLLLDNRIVRFLLDDESLDEEMDSFTDLFHPADPLPGLLVGEEIQAQVRSFATAYYNDQPTRFEKNLIYFIYGPPGSGKKLHAKHFCHYFAQSLLIVDLKALMLTVEDRQFSFQEWLPRIFREAILLQAVVCFDHFQLLVADESNERRWMNSLLEAMKRFRGIVFLLADREWQDVELQRQHILMKLELQLPDEAQRKRIWGELAQAYSLHPNVDLGLIASKFRLTTGQIKNALEAGKQLSIWKHGQEAAITAEELSAGGYLQIQHNLHKKAVRLRPKYSWDDVILPDAQKSLLRNACNQMKYRHIVFGEWGFDRQLSYGKGLSMLFSGPPGTGKTMSAEVIANELELEIYKVDMSQVISKYIGETEQNLREIFQEAQLSNAILFFDEADALFGKRSEVKDSHDKHANTETAYLLQKMEEYSGVSILASNFLQNIDEAFMRRLTFVIKFPFPDSQYRQFIWKSMFPREALLDNDVDFGLLAAKFEIAGGNIKNAAVSAAFLAAAEGKPIGMKHILKAVIQEVSKAGGIVRKEQLGIYGEDISLV